MAVSGGGTWPSLYWALLCLLVWIVFSGMVTYSRTFFSSLSRQSQPLAIPTINFWDADLIAGGYVGG